MPFKHIGNLRCYQFAHLDANQVIHGVFTRHGGVSPEPWKSLNVGATVGDDLDRVKENTQRVLQAMGCTRSSLFNVWQVHQAKVLVADKPREGKLGIPKADAVITNNPQITLFMRFADCVPLYFFDPEQSAIGLAHAGWKGTLERIAQKTIHAMEKEFGSQPENIKAGIGPSIGPDHYEIQEDVMRQFRKAFPESFPRFFVKEDGKVRLDLWEANRFLIKQAGAQDVEIAGVCTACHPQDWFSHRAENGKTGRFGAIFRLR
ncbi:MAG: peptidoglycan editing factor PgeF [Anaerolineales bacterium]